MPTFDETLYWVYASLLRAGQPHGPDAQTRDPSTTALLCAEAGIPLHGIPAITVSGSKGKGSTALLAARSAQQSSGLRWLLFGGVLLPGASIAALLAWGIPAGQRMAYADTDPPALTIEVSARQWQWDVHYPDRGVRLVDTLYLPAGEVVDIRLGSADVIHSFWIPRLGGKMDAVPGRIHRLRLRADEPGEYHGQCAEYCGIDHAFMRLRVQVLSPQAFAAWMEAAAR